MGDTSSVVMGGILWYFVYIEEKKKWKLSLVILGLQL